MRPRLAGGSGGRGSARRSGRGRTSTVAPSPPSQAVERRVQAGRKRRGTTDPQARDEGRRGRETLGAAEAGWKRGPHAAGAASTRDERRRARETLGAAEAGWKRGLHAAGVTAATELRAAVERNLGRGGRRRTGGGDEMSREEDGQCSGAIGAGRRRLGSEAGIASADERRAEQGSDGKRRPRGAGQERRW